jgi:hypothetical protein
MQHAPEWVERHRKIARKVKPGAGMFIRRMLEQDCRITRGMKGIDPEKPCKYRPAMEAHWLKEHPMITPAEREIMRGRVKSFIRPSTPPNIEAYRITNQKRYPRYPQAPSGAWKRDNGGPAGLPKEEA